MVFILDFDDTLFDKNKFKEGLEKLFGRFGVSPKMFRQSYRWVKKNSLGYDAKKHLAILLKFLPGVLDKKKAQRAIDKFLKTARNFIYPDAKKFLKQARKNHDLILLTYGSKKWQQTKVKNSGLAPLFKKIIYTQDLFKQEPLKKILPKFKNQMAVFVDNDPRVLESIRQKHPGIFTVQIIRPGIFLKKSQNQFSVKNFNGFLTRVEKIIKSKNYAHFKS